MYVATPEKMFNDIINDAEKLPRGYGLLRFVFGPYGVGFEDWCMKNGFPHPSTKVYNSMATCNDMDQLPTTSSTLLPLSEMT